MTDRRLGDFILRWFLRWSDQPALLNTVREVSYRFRVNGINPEDHRTVFVSRLTRIREALVINPEPQRVRRKLAELVFLAAVVPTEAHETIDGGASAADVLHEVQEVARRIEEGRREHRLFFDLRQIGPFWEPENSSTIARCHGHQRAGGAEERAAGVSGAE
jgi:hypothetical protein